MNIDQAIKDMNESLPLGSPKRIESNKGVKQITTKAKVKEKVLSNPPVQSNKEIITSLTPMTDKEKKELAIDYEKLEKDRLERIGRSRVMTVSMQAKVVRLAKRYFFMRSVAGKAGISTDTIEKYLVHKDFKRFSLAFTHARDRWITFHQDLLTQYATDKKTKDWHAIKYLLTIADKEFSERKYLTEAVSNQEAKILMLIKAESLTLATKQGKDMLKTVSNTPLESEPISLLPFNEEDPKNKGKAKVKKGKK